MSITLEELFQHIGALYTELQRTRARAQDLQEQLTKAQQKLEELRKAKSQDVL